MRKHKTITLTSIIMLELILAACAGGAGGGGVARVITVQRMEGDDHVMTRGDEREYDVHEGMKLAAAYTATTGPASYLYLNLDGQSVVKTDERTTVAVESISDQNLALSVVTGALAADIERKGGDTYTVRAGNTVLGVRGTSFIVENRAAPFFVMLLGSGEIDGAELAAGQVATVTDGEATVRPLVIDGSLSAFVLTEILARQDELLREGVLTSDDIDRARELMAGGGHGPSGDGAYEGAYDENGKFSGWGVWTYHNFHYEGYFVDGAPNGEGLLSEARTPPAEREEGHSYAVLVVTGGTFVNGFPNGPISLTWYMDNGEIHNWYFEVEHGHAHGGVAYCINCSAELSLDAETIVAGVPPWAEVWTNPAVPPLSVHIFDPFYYGPDYDHGGGAEPSVEWSDEQAERDRQEALWASDEMAFYLWQTEGGVQQEFYIFLSPGIFTGEVNYVIQEVYDGDTLHQQYGQADGVYGDNMNLFLPWIDMRNPDEALIAEGYSQLFVADDGAVLIYETDFHRSGETRTLVLERVW